MGNEKYKFPPLAKTLDNSLQAFFAPRGSRESPYLPRPMCSATCKQEREEMELSSNGKERISPFTDSKFSNFVSIGLISTKVTLVTEDKNPTKSTLELTSICWFALL